MGRAHSEPSESVKKLIGQNFSNLAGKYLLALEKTLPDLSQSELKMRMIFMVGSMAYTLTRLAAPEQFQDSKDFKKIGAKTKQELINFVKAGFES